MVGRRIFSVYALGVGVWACWSGSAGAYLGPTGACGTPDMRKIAYRAVATDGRGVIYALGTDDRVHECAYNGYALAVFGGSGSGEGQLDRPSSAAVDSTGALAVVDSGNQRLVRFGANRRMLSSWALPAPRAVAAAPDATLYVTTQPPGDQPRIRQLSLSGSALRSWPVPGGVDHLAVGPNGDVYASRAVHQGEVGGGSITTFSARGRRLAKWRFHAGELPRQFAIGAGPWGLAVQPNGTLWVADPSNRRLQAFASDGGVTMVCGDGLQSFFYNPLDVAIGADSFIQVADDNEGTKTLSPTTSPVHRCLGVPARLSGLRVAPARFRPARTPGGRATTIRFSLSRRAPVGATIYRSSGSSRRFIFVGRLVTRMRRPGDHALAFAGWVRGHRLTAGRYRIRLSALDARGRIKSPATASFTVR